MIFYVHGWHKLEGWIGYLQHGTPWKLVEEVAGMHFPPPLASAVAGGKAAAARALLSLGASPHVKSEFGKSPYESAMSGGDDEMREVFSGLAI